MNIDNPEINDNRNYNYFRFLDSDRDEYSIIVEMIEHEKNVIDLGCGNGSLLELLRDQKKCNATGVEISETGIEQCRKKDLNVLHAKIDEPLPFEKDSFDYAVCNVTIQMVMYPEILLKEMKRIASYQIISFPNFAYYKNRLDFLFKGRMPKPMLFGYEWYNTGHIHQFSLRDFYSLVNSIGGLKILSERSFGKVRFIQTKNLFKNFLMNSFPNLFVNIPIILLRKESLDEKSE